MRESKAKKIVRASEIVSRLFLEYPNSKCSLNYSSAHELLMATILSAQCTDHRVNMVTKNLFLKYQKPADFAYCNLGKLAKDIHSCGYHNQKARSLQGASLKIVEEYDGKVPQTLEELIKLPKEEKMISNLIYFHDQIIFTVNNRA